MEKAVVVGAMGTVLVSQANTSVADLALTAQGPHVSVIEKNVLATELKAFSTVKSITVLQPVRTEVPGVTVLAATVPLKDEDGEIAVTVVLDNVALECATVLQPAEIDVSTLRLENQTIAELICSSYWEAVCPWLTVTSAASQVAAVAKSVASVAIGETTLASSIMLDKQATVSADSATLSASDLYRKELMGERGFFKVHAADVKCDQGMLSRLETGVHKLVSLGHAPNAIMIYDEAWLVGENFRELLERSTGNVASGDCVAFLVKPGFHVFKGPHRDKPNGGDSSFRQDMDVYGSKNSPEMPMYTTAWLALSSATAEQSCLYFLPADKDPGYRAQGDAILQALDGPHAWPRIEAQPCASGDLLCFSHRLLHWGGEASPAALPRVALSYAFADPDFEESAFCSTYLPLPPLELRLALIAGQAIIYNAQSPLDKGQLALNNRIFLSQKNYFKDAYVNKVTYAAQSLKFLMAQRRGKQ